jgi:hypothetical protein
MTREELKKLLVEHFYIFSIKQCRCQTLLDRVEPEHPKDWTGVPVYGVYS